MRDIILLYKDMMREDKMVFDDILARVRAPTQQELKIAERVSAYNVGNRDKDPRIDELEEECRKRKVYHRNVRKFPSSVSKAAHLKDDNPS